MRSHGQSHVRQGARDRFVRVRVSGDGQATSSSRGGTTATGRAQTSTDAAVETSVAASAPVASGSAGSASGEAVLAATPTSVGPRSHLSPRERPSESHSPSEYHSPSDFPALPFSPYLRLQWRLLQQQPLFTHLPLPADLASRQGAGRGARRGDGGRDARKGDGGRGDVRGGGKGGGGRGEGEGAREREERGERAGQEVEDTPRVTNWLVETSALRRVRLSYVDYGERVQALNTLCYPRFSCDLPLLAVELLCFNSSRLLAFIDLQPSSPQQLERLKEGRLLPPAVSARLNAIRSQHAHLLTPMSARFFASDSCFFSPHLLLYRSQEGCEDANMQPPTGSMWHLFTEYLAAYHEACMACGGAAGRTEADGGAAVEGQRAAEDRYMAAVEGQRAFDAYFEENDPAVKMLNQFFGHQWAQAYTNRFLFPLAAHRRSTAPPSSPPSLHYESASPFLPSPPHGS
ncbi:hypothetical protein CLOM_g15974 [Closterium sp. NIES-68]|nr:hypothetical protein CLOM_g15974 [Closterium sp. NIES-68]